MTSHPVTRTIDCAECSMVDTDHCQDCVVSYLCGPISAPTSAPTAVVFDLAELRAMKLLADAGLVPTLRHRVTG